ncbi:CdaR family protein [Aquibacillus koreensis]|uniref:CdaR family protein n=1 Tax=Aquibacillus koreensis TaxID=279446 RepID=A0A9X3WRI7_9BACI|nr:CdaR family protein [Aquibacillus koreensis]MCT2536104.1 CdaR family protein [Aquibacillus koreensis]MDC3422029.1 CdaR family protein [Aquibacillus koreensis]
MDEWLKKPWVIRVVSLALAVLLFIAVTLDQQEQQSDSSFPLSISSSEETQTIEEVPVEIRIDEDRYVVSGVPETVSVGLQGSVSQVTSTARQQNFDVFVDLEELEPGTHTVPIRYSGISSSITVYIEPEQIQVTIEEKASDEFEVSVDFINEAQLPVGYELGDVTVEPSAVRITSARSIVDNIAIVKAFVDVKDADEPIELSDVPVKAYDNQGNELQVRVEPSTVSVSVDVRSPNKEVPIDIETTGEAQEGISISNMEADPEVVQVFAADGVLENISAVSTQEIDLSEITENTTLEVPIEVPTDIRKTNIEVVTILIEVERTIETTFEEVPIEVDNLGEDLSISFVEPLEGELDVTALGLEDLVNELSLDDIRLFIEVEENQAGEYTLPLRIEGPEGVELETEIENVTVLIE